MAFIKDPNTGLMVWNSSNTSGTGLAARQSSGDGLGSYGTYTDANGIKTGINESAYNSMKSAGTDGITQGDTGIWDSIKNMFTPTGDAGTSVGGSILKDAGDVITTGTGLAGMYYNKKNYDLAKDKDKFNKAQIAKSDDRASRFALNAGGGASY